MEHTTLGKTPEAQVLELREALRKAQDRHATEAMDWNNKYADTRTVLACKIVEFAEFKHRAEDRIKKLHNDGTLCIEETNEVLSDLNLPTIDLQWHVSGHYDATYHLSLGDCGLRVDVAVSVEVPFTVMVEASDEEIATEEAEGMHLSDLDLDWDRAEVHIDNDYPEIEDLDELVRVLLETEPYLTAEIVVDEVEEARP